MNVNSLNKFFVGFCFVLAAALLFSCVKEEDTSGGSIQPKKGYMVVTCKAPEPYPAAEDSKSTLRCEDVLGCATDSSNFDSEGDSTKTHLDSDKMTVLWDNGDGICAFQSGTPVYAENEAGSGSSQAQFQLPVGTYSYAFFPGKQESDASVSGSTITIPGGFPYIQQLTDGNFARDVNLMVAKAPTSDKVWNFYNAGGLLKVAFTIPSGQSVTVKDLNANSPAIILRDLNGGRLSGDAVVTMNADGTIASSSVADNGNKSSCVCLSTSGLSNGEITFKGETEGEPEEVTYELYFMVPPGTYGGNGKGFSLEVTLKSGEVYCFMNPNSITTTFNTNKTFAKDLPIRVEDAVILTSGNSVKGYYSLTAAASTVQSGETVKLLREKFWDNSKCEPTFTAPCTFDLNGYGYRGNLFIQNTTGTFTVKNGCVWQYEGPQGSWPESSKTDGEIDGAPGSSDQYAGRVVVDNVKAAAVWTDGHPYDLHNTILFKNGLKATHANAANIFAGCIISSVNKTGTSAAAFTTVNIYGTESVGGAVADNPPIFDDDPTGNTGVNVIDGNIANNGTTYVEFNEPFRPYTAIDKLPSESEARTGYYMQWNYNPYKPVTGVTLDKNTASIIPGATLTLTATVTPGDATDPSITWSSSDNTKATVSDAGVVTGVAAGSVTITATSNDVPSIKATCTVTIKQIYLAPLTASNISTNAPMKYVSQGKNADQYGWGSGDWYYNISDAQKTAREDKYGKESNLWDGNSLTYYHQNLDYGKVSTSWGVRDDVKFDDLRYFQINLPVESNHIKLWFKNTKDENRAQKADGLEILVSTNGTDFSIYDVGNLNPAFEAENTVYIQSDKKIKALRIRNTRIEPGGSWTQQAFGLAELKLWTENNIAPTSITGVNLTAPSTTIETTHSVIITAHPMPEGVSMSSNEPYVWQITSGSGSLSGGNNSTVTLTANSSDGEVTVRCTAKDSQGNTAVNTITIKVFSPKTQYILSDTNSGDGPNWNTSEHYTKIKEYSTTTALTSTPTLVFDGNTFSINSSHIPSNIVGIGVYKCGNGGFDIPITDSEAVYYYGPSSGGSAYLDGALTPNTARILTYSGWGNHTWDLSGFVNGNWYAIFTYRSSGGSGAPNRIIVRNVTKL